jgi:uncharacterized glyoxalase superfamily protein PhnB
MVMGSEPPHRLGVSLGDDADHLAEVWRSAGVEVHAPEDTEWGQHEGAVVDSDGNVVRFGSSMESAAKA